MNATVRSITATVMVFLLLPVSRGQGAVGAEEVAMPLKRVVLFTSGVGYFEHSGEVDSSSRVTLRFRPEVMVDVIRSLVVLDRGSGSVVAGVYDSREPLERTLRSLSVNLADNPALHQILRRLRGRSVELATLEGSLRGRVVSVQKRTVIGEKGTEEHYAVNLLTGDGLRSVSLDDIRSCAVADDQVNRDLDRALNLLATARDRNHKLLRLVFSGGERREVRIGYLRETPVWKTSYRIVKQGDRTLLQGWAHLENTTETDWNDVRLTLTSARPVSFIQNLYDPIYVKRPEIPLPGQRRLQPGRHEDRLTETLAAEFEKSPLRMKGLFAGRAGAPAAAMREEAEAYPAAPTVSTMEALQPTAAGQRTGEMFVYRLKQPLTLEKNRAAMVPILNAMVAAEWLTVINPRINSGTPMNCVVVSNTSGNFLSAGPVTVFEEGIYAGEGLLSDTPEGGEKIISYAGDPRSLADIEEKPVSEAVVSVKIVKGTLEARVKKVVKTDYTIRNRRSDLSRSYLVEHPIRRGWTLTAPTGSVQRTADFYRFRMSVPPRSSKTLQVVEEKVIHRSYGLSSLTPDRILYYVSGQKISAAVREALQRTVNMRREIEDLERRIADLERERREIQSDQARIRENMRVLARSDQLFMRYMKKLNAQEDRTERITSQLVELRERLRRKKAELDDYLSNLTIE